MRALVAVLLLTCSIAHAELRVDIAPSSADERVTVVLTNKGSVPVKVFREAYSWGYYGVSFEITTRDGKTQVLKKKPRGWDKNVPAFGEVAPGKSIDFTEILTEEEWSLPKLSGPITLRAVYAIEPDAESKKLGVWTGSVRSAPVQYAWPGTNLVQVDIASSSAGNHVKVVLTNVGAVSQKVFREDCSWGHGAVSFEAMTNAGKLVTLAKKPIGWRANVPSYDVLAPGKSVEREETLAPATWTLPASGKVHLRAVFTVEADETTKQVGAWTGTTRSQLVPFTLP